MGKAARLKQQRRQERIRTGVADIEVVCPGMLEVLSVGKGDINLSIDPSKPEDVDNARKMIEEMLRKGYGIFLEDSIGRLRRVKKFNPKRMEYVISEVVEYAEEKPRGKRTRDKAVPVAGSKAKAIGRTAGG